MARGDIWIRLEVRPIYYKNQKALFHKWSNYSRVIEPSFIRGGHQGGVVSGTMAIIETADGTVLEVYPTDIQFADPGYISDVWNNQRISPMKKEGDDE